MLANVLNERHQSTASLPFARHLRRPPRHYRPEYHVLYWGDVLLDGPPGLNRVPVLNKKREVEVLNEAGVPTVCVSPRPLDGLWLPRVANHVGGRDLLHPGRADYFVRKEEIANEYRVHVFKHGDDYVSIRTGRKAPMEGVGAHEWIRSREGGWHLVYDGHGVKDVHRAPAKAAVKALGLDFAAVDVAERPDGSVFVLEVNRAPGLEAKTAEVYARHIEIAYGIEQIGSSQEEQAEGE